MNIKSDEKSLIFSYYKLYIISGKALLKFSKDLIICNEWYLYATQVKTTSKRFKNFLIKIKL